jgi:predicted RNase H-like HicB family nuclease
VAREANVQTARFVYWQDEEMFVGHFMDYFDYWTQGTTLDDLKDHLRGLYADIVQLRLG